MALQAGLRSLIVSLSGLAAGVALAGPALAQNATVDLAGTDIAHDLRRVGDVADGETVAVTVGGLVARRNADPADDHYVYFDVADEFLHAVRLPEVSVTFHYFDDPGGVDLSLQYDSTTEPYKTAGGFRTTGTNVWKVYTVVLRDAWFANRQNGGADFRIAASPGATFYVDLAYVRVPGAHYPLVRISPAQHIEVRPQPLRDICARWAEWTAARASSDVIGSADHILNSLSDVELRECFEKINGSPLTLSVDVPVLKEHAECPSGPACFDAHVGLWDRFESLGARIESFYMDEPFFAVRAYRDQLPYRDEDAINQVVVWMRLMRERYPHAQLMQVEPYPALSPQILNWWQRALQAACAAHGVPMLDFFIVDHDWAASGWTYGGIRDIQAQTAALGIRFGVLFWASNRKTSTSDPDWRIGLMQQGRMYQRNGISPDMYDINDFMAIPLATVPEIDADTYTYSIRSFTSRFVRRRY